jgi:hypothetical protein
MRAVMTVALGKRRRVMAIIGYSMVVLLLAQTPSARQGLPSLLLQPHMIR